MHPKGQGECKHRLMGMSELLKCCAASRGGCAALRTWGFKVCLGSRDAAACCICQSPPGLTRTGTKRSPALPGAEVLPLCREQWGGGRLTQEQLLCQPTTTIHWERFPTSSLPGAIHQCLWDKREDLSKLCLPSPLDFPPATSIFSLGGHKIKAASEPMWAVHGYPALLNHSLILPAQVTTSTNSLLPLHNRGTTQNPG